MVRDWEEEENEEREQEERKEMKTDNGGAEGEQGLGYWAARLIVMKRKKFLVHGEGALCFAVSARSFSPYSPNRLLCMNPF